MLLLKLVRRRCWLAPLLILPAVGDECGYRCRGVLGLVNFLGRAFWKAWNGISCLVGIEKPVVECLAREICLGQTNRSYAGRELGRSGQCGCNKSSGDLAWLAFMLDGHRDCLVGGRSGLFRSDHGWAVPFLVGRCE